MWLRNLLLLAIVACSISAPTDNPVTQPSRHIKAIFEAERLLNDSKDTDALTETVKVVAGRVNPQTLTCLQTRLHLYKQGLRGSLTSLEGLLNIMAEYYKTHCPEIPETACINQTVTFKNFKDHLRNFLLHIPFEC
ncbi:PREDICTED: granulocyte-macrophage colony-stimulating factor [Chrysochloris asiatica]|uniref:Granulocyte-macrophage colony-stimulating factor n=1 Tax=Chrysochloris asiatica TaxID=185453 RepID=A0A9B0TZ21_CHRAS|nr:PREDICTED: granulocyte-macrophage colony-stimulating factor [Chrysochloris asiatica]